jgi:transcriptional regulator with XRE-family HTH domain
MEEKQAWRNLLGKIISEPHERQKIADIAGINPVTLLRWANGKSNPREDNLRPLLNALPQHRQELSELIAREFPQFFHPIRERGEALEMIPAPFYARVLQAYTNSPPILRASAVETLILQQIESQFDPQRLGITISVAQCVPPTSGHKIRSLRITAHRSTTTTDQLMEHQTAFLGAESQAGYALSAGHPSIMQNEADMIRVFPAHHSAMEKSAVAYPIIISNRAAGSLYLSSTQTEYFSQYYLDLIECYIDLMVLSFEKDNFYDLSEIELSMMPSLPLQKDTLATFQRRVKQKMLLALQEKRSLTRLQAESIVWQELEEELLHLALKGNA